MGMARVAFDPSLPVVVACSDLPCGPKRFSRGDAFPWRDLGLSEFEVAQLWGALQVDCVERTEVAEVAEVVLKLPGVATENLARNLAQRELAARARPVPKRRS